VAQRVLVTVLSLPPRRRAPVASARLRRSLRPSQRQQLLGLRMSDIVGATSAFTLVTAR
jgi:hypothetical protein